MLFIFILWHSPFSNPLKKHSRSAENMVALDEIGSLSHTFRQGDEMKHSSGVSQSQRGDEQFVILQYCTRYVCFFIVAFFEFHARSITQIGQITMDNASNCNTLMEYLEVLL